MRVYSFSIEERERECVCFHRCNLFYCTTITTTSTATASNRTLKNSRETHVFLFGVRPEPAFSWKKMNFFPEDHPILFDQIDGSQLYPYHNHTPRSGTSRVSSPRFESFVCMKEYRSGLCRIFSSTNHLLQM